MQQSNKLFCLTGVSCGTLQNGTNTVAVTTREMLYENTHTYECIEGYETDMALNAECTASGSMSIPLPVCGE